MCNEANAIFLLLNIKRMDGILYSLFFLRRNKYNFFIEILYFNKNYELKIFLIIEKLQRGKGKMRGFC